MLSKGIVQYIEDGFQEALSYMGDMVKDTLQKLELCTDDEKLLMKYYYGSMPYSDMVDVEFELLQKFARHAIFVRKNSEWCKEVPEQIFLTDVAAYRINNEKIVDCRDFFYNQLIDRVKGLPIKEAVLEVNYWCAENATYQASDFRTASPLTVYLSGKGRCGEESVFTVTALRSLGIPARQVYTPKWAHCDDNHAWVEVWCDGQWYFLGACEPEAVLNKGWFTGPASRAMIIHSRYFTNIPVKGAISREGLVTFTNNTSLYAKTINFTVEVVDIKGDPLPDTEVRFEILNSAIYSPIATKKTDSKGQISLELGKGSLRLHLRRGKMYQVENASTKDGKVRIVFTGKGAPSTHWLEYELIAPKEEMIHPGTVTEKQIEENTKRLENAKKIRECRLNSYYNEEKAEHYPNAKELLREAKGNFDEVYKFLDKDDNPYRLALLNALAKKDLLDLKADVLEEHLQYACHFVKGVPEDIFVSYLLNPRIEYEELSKYRKFIQEYFSDEQKEKFCRNPKNIWNYIEEEIKYDESRDYGALRITPVGALRMKLASPVSKRILFVAICRSLGIPARLNPVDGEPEYYDGSLLVSAYKAKAEKGSKSSLILYFEPDTEWVYYVSWTLGILRDGIFHTLDLNNEEIDENCLKLEIEAGDYRILITTRTPSGNQLVREYYFNLPEGERKEIFMEKYKERIEDYLIHQNISEFVLKDNMGNRISSREWMYGQRKVFIWLEEGKEPTEHILNELMEAEDRLQQPARRIVLLVHDFKAMEAPTLKKTLEKIKGLQCYVSEDWTQARKIAVELRLDENKFPLAFVVDADDTVIYATCGYNVGSVNLMLKLL